LAAKRGREALILEVCPARRKSVTKERLCAFNVTRQSFLNFGVEVADTHLARLRGLLGRLSLRSDEGLWIVPCQGVHTLGVLFPIDVIYLDEKLRVVKVVEHLGPFRVAPLRMRSSSVLELPTRTVYSSNTQVGDQLLVGTPEELADYWNSPPVESVAEGQPAAHSVADGRGSPAQGPVVGLETRGDGWVSRLSRLEEPPTRKAPHVCAYFWEGGAPQSHDVVKISETGAYLKTAEPWRLATIIDLTLQPKPANGNGSKDPKHAVRLSSQVVRSDPEGISVRFLYARPEERQGVRNLLAAVKTGKA